MADPRPIVFGPGDKLSQCESVARHPDATDLDSRITIVVCSRIDKHLGNAVVGQAWIAKAIGCVERSVRSSAMRMQRLGLWHITAGGGRGLANIWTPMAKKPGSHVPGIDDKPGMPVPGSDPKTRQSTTLNPAIDDRKPGTYVPPLPNNYLNSSLGAASEPSVCGDDRWKPIRLRLEDHLGPEICRAWFDRVRLRSIDATEIVIEAPSSFHRQRIENEYSDAIVRAVRAADVDATVVRARVVLAGSPDLKAVAQ